MARSDTEHQPEDVMLASQVWQRQPLWLRLIGGVVVLMILFVGSFELAYMGKIYPGVTADGDYVGGMSRQTAAARLVDKTTEFSGHPVTITDGDTDLRIPVGSIGTTYDTSRAAALAYTYGRQGNPLNRLRDQLRALLGRQTNFAAYSYDDNRLADYVVSLADDLVGPVQNASLTFNDGQAQVTPSTAGKRLDLGHLTQLISDRLAFTSTDTIQAPVYSLDPELPTAPLQATASQLGAYLSAPITLVYSGTRAQIDQRTIISWIQVSPKPHRQFLQTLNLNDVYPAPPAANLGLSRAAIVKYVANLSKGIDQTPHNATLAMQNGQVVVTGPSRSGVKVDQPTAVDAIASALAKTGEGRQISLNLATAKADVNEDNINDLGIKEQISEGQTLFPGSPSARLTNVSAGAAKFNGVVLKPGEVFSFGALLGSVGPETGYVPELVILGNHEEKQYGGGLCQVSSTAFRAALAAGLPIVERHNHSFAISYYTAPYGVPGVDATIYYPQVDFKFRNDTGSFLLIQTVMQGTSLKFDFYGTKTKTGVIRGPEFVSGSTDATQPSHTVFYRDVLDLTGAVTKTDKFDTFYKSSKDFPVTPQFN